MVELALVEPKASKRPSAVVRAMSRLLAQLEAVMLPMVRTRADSAASAPLIGGLLAQWYSILHTVAAPQEHKSNGRVEHVVRRLKQQVTCAKSHGLVLLVLQAVAAMWCS